MSRRPVPSSADEAQRRLGVPRREQGHPRAVDGWHDQRLRTVGERDAIAAGQGLGDDADRTVARRAPCRPSCRRTIPYSPHIRSLPRGDLRHLARGGVVDDPLAVADPGAPLHHERAVVDREAGLRLLDAARGHRGKLDVPGAVERDPVVLAQAEDARAAVEHLAVGRVDPAAEHLGAVDRREPGDRRGVRDRPQVERRAAAAIGRGDRDELAARLADLDAVDPDDLLLVAPQPAEGSRLAVTLGEPRVTQPVRQRRRRGTCRPRVGRGRGGEPRPREPLRDRTHVAEGGCPAAAPRS